MDSKQTKLDYYKQINDEYNTLLKRLNETSSLLDIYKFIENKGYYTKEELITVYTVNQRSLNNILSTLNDIKKDIRYFSIAVIFDGNNNIYLSQRVNPDKDLFGYYGVAGGKREEGESFEQCAIREIKEEAGIDIKLDDLFFISIHEYIPDHEDLLFNCAIFIAYIRDQIPKRTEPNNHDD